jgi:TonB-dependent receptor
VWRAEYLVVDPSNVFLFGNPQLEAMKANSLDVSIGWYASEDLFLQAAFFYKDISDFIVAASGLTMSIDELPFRLPVEQITTFNFPADQTMTNVSTFLNGQDAQVYGIELVYSQNFTEGWLNGFFVSSNLTLQDSEANVGNTVRAETIQLPDQADITFNATVGWENDTLSARLIANYRSEILKRIGSCTAADIAADQVTGYAERCTSWADLYQDESMTYDFRGTYQITDDIKLYFDALNLTDEVDYNYFVGNQYSNGNMMYRSEHYGRSFQVGVNVKFY